MVAYANLGAVYRKLGLLSDARRALQKELWWRLRQGVRSLWRRRGALDLRSAARLAALAEAQVRVGNARHAAQIARRALEIDPDNAAALRVHIAALLRQGRTEEALAAAQHATQARPDDAALQAQLARALAGLERFEEAIAAYQRSLPAGSGPARAGRMGATASAARRRRRRRAAVAPGAAARTRRRGIARGARRSLPAAAATQEAEAQYRRALQLDARHFVAQVRLSDVLRDSGRLDEAEAAAQRALELDDEAVSGHFALGMAHKAKGRMEQAIRSFRRALELDPGAVQAMQQLALALREEDRLEDAETQLRAALRLRPDHIGLLADHGMVLADLMRYDEALACFDRALARSPQSVMAINRKALIVDHLGEREQGLALLQQAARLAPKDEHAKYNIGLHHLKYGEYAAGWDGYECRRSFESFVGRHRRFALPEWDGTSLEGRTLLVQPEQGLGDEIMFGSCIPEVAARAKHVIVECDAKLEAIFRRSFPIARWSRASARSPTTGCSASSRGPMCRSRPARLPAASGAAPPTFPQHQGFLKADRLASRLARAAGRARPGRKIGLSWQGGVGFTGRKRRSLTLEQLLPILRLPASSSSICSTPRCATKCGMLESRHGVKVHHWQEAIDDYDQTAALVPRSTAC